MNHSGWTRRALMAAAAATLAMTGIAKASTRTTLCVCVVGGFPLCVIGYLVGHKDTCHEILQTSCRGPLQCERAVD